MSFADMIERKWHSCLACLAIALFGIWFANVDSTWALIALGACLAMSAQWLSFGLHNYQAELYPTRIRARGVGFVYSWSRLSGILTPFFIAFFLREYGPTGVFAFVAVCMGGRHLVGSNSGSTYEPDGSGGDRTLSSEPQFSLVGGDRGRGIMPEAIRDAGIRPRMACDLRNKGLWTRRRPLYW